MMQESAVYFDCSAGFTGDMIVSSLMDLGIPLQYLRETVGALPLEGCEIKTFSEKRNSLRGTRFSVTSPSSHRARRYPDIIRIIQESNLSPDVKERSAGVFRTLAEAEVHVQGDPMEQVSLREAGTAQCIAGVVSTLCALEYLGIQQCLCGRVPLGHGLLQDEDGPIPLPAPATLHILRGVPVYGAELQGETVTPTGAAIMTAVCSHFGIPPLMRIQAVGHGMGSRTWPDRPDVLRAVLGTGYGRSDEVMVIETNVDDLSPELAGHLMDRLMRTGALDVVFIPAYMKKNRPGLLVQVLCPPASCDDLMTVLFTESTTIGARYHRVQRVVLPRRIDIVETPLGAIQVKVVTTPDGRRRAFPEFESCRQAAAKHGLPLMDVYAAVAAAAPRKSETGDTD